jgi:ATP/maltotriose-dependent transcriptional regulator MalT
MTISLLQMKVHTPRIQPEPMARPHLIEQLNAGLHCKLTLLSAPAGAGKTTQLIERYSLEMVKRGELVTLLRWIDALPDAVAYSRPWLCIHQAWPLTFAGQADAAMRALLATMQGDIARAIEQARQEAHEQPLRQARRPQPHPGRRPRPGAWAVAILPTQTCSTAPLPKNYPFV